MSRASDPPRTIKATFWAVAAVVGFFALYPDILQPSGNWLWGSMPYVKHAFAFATLAIIGISIWGMRWRFVAGLALAATVLELAQAFAPGHSVQPADLVASIAGIGIGLALRRVWSALQTPGDA